MSQQLTVPRVLIPESEVPCDMPLKKLPEDVSLSLRRSKHARKANVRLRDYITGLTSQWLWKLLVFVIFCSVSLHIYVACAHRKGGVPIEREVCPWKGRCVHGKGGVPMEREVCPWKGRCAHRKGGVPIEREVCP